MKTKNWIEFIRFLADFGASLDGWKNWDSLLSFVTQLSAPAVSTKNLLINLIAFHRVKKKGGIRPAKGPRLSRFASLFGNLNLRDELQQRAA